MDTNNKYKYLFNHLLKKFKTGIYDDAYLQLLAEYYQINPVSERFDIFYARYAIAHGNYKVALEYGENAYKKRKVNLEIWKILAECYAALGFPLKALIFQGYCSKFYGIPLEMAIPKDHIREYMDQLSLAMGIGNYAPFAAHRMVYSAGGLSDPMGVFAGEYIPFPHEEDYSYWVGCYEEQESLTAKAWLLNEEKDKAEFVRCCGADFVFDIMKSRTMQEVDITCENSTVLLPVAGTVEGQQLNFSSAHIQDSIWLGKWAYSFFRLDESVKVQSEQPFAMGEPVRLGHSLKRKKLVLNILVDALSWPIMKHSAYKYMPNTMKFFSKGVIFNNHFSVGEYTYPSFPSIETGMYPHHSQIFNERASHELDKEYKTLSEKMKELGYYCVNIMGSGDAIYNGATRGYDRMIINSYALHTYVGVERVIRQLEAFGECDQFLLMHVMDVHPWTVQKYQVPIETQTKLSLGDRLKGDKTSKASVYLPHTPLYMEANRQGMENADRSLKVLFDYIGEHYDEDEYIVQLYSDHGVPIYDAEPYLLSEHQVGAALMMRGSGVPSLGIVDELTSAIDIYPIMAHHAGFEVGSWVDGNLPEVLGGKRREYVISNSIYPGQTYKLCIRTMAHELHLESQEPVDEDGTVDLTDAFYELFKRGDSLEKIHDLGLEEYFLDIVDKHTASFNHQGQFWPSMRNARLDWFNKTGKLQVQIEH